ncbi:MAG: hypothetical protein Q9222_007851 [Ikaeria aurantiellina]
MAEATPDLETFRRQWREEVIARSHAKRKTNSISNEQTSAGKPEGSNIQRTLPRSEVPTEEMAPMDGISIQAYHDLEDNESTQRLGVDSSDRGPGVEAAREPKSALDHYERAIEREDQGNLGDSVKLYRQAFRLDAGVDRAYKSKHFPPSDSKTKPADPTPSNAAVTVPNPAHHSLDDPSSTSIVFGDIHSSRPTSHRRHAASSVPYREHSF